MQRASYPAAGIGSAVSVVSARPFKRKGFFAVLLAALHHSRRIQARRILRYHRELIAGAKKNTA